MDEIAFAPLQLGLAREEVLDRVEEAMQALRIEKLRDRAPHRLSGGEKRRVALASVLTLRPDVWLLDEPTTGLDPRSQSWLVDFILEQRDQGKTVITATHNLEVAEEIASAVYRVRRRPLHRRFRGAGGHPVRPRPAAPLQPGALSPARAAPGTALRLGVTYRRKPRRHGEHGEKEYSLFALSLPRNERQPGIIRIFPDCQVEAGFAAHLAEPAADY